MSWTNSARKSPRTAQAIHELIPTSSPIEGAAAVISGEQKAKDKTTWRNLIKTWWEENSTISNNLRTMKKKYKNIVGIVGL
jgi:hypothetical protein